MDKKIFLFSLLIVLAMGTVFAATQSVVVDTRGALIGVYSAEYERLFSSKVSVDVQGQICNYTEDNSKLLAFNLAVGRRQYILEQDFSGAYWGAYGTASYIKTESAVTTGLGVAGSIGYKHILDSGMVVDLGFSLGIPLITNIKADNTAAETVNFGALGLGLSLGLGYAW
mgnify:FL=1|jgi:hypothetical protein